IFQNRAKALPVNELCFSVSSDVPQFINAITPNDPDITENIDAVENRSVAESIKGFSASIENQLTRWKFFAGHSNLGIPARNNRRHSIFKRPLEARSGRNALSLQTKRLLIAKHRKDLLMHNKPS